MSYTHTHLPELDILKKILKLNPNQIKYYAKYGGLIGSTESVNYLTKKINDYNTTTKS